MGEVAQHAERPCEVGAWVTMLAGGAAATGSSLATGTRHLRPAADGGVPAATGGAAEELGAEHLFQQAVGKHRRNDRVLGAVPRQRREFAVKVAGDVHRAGSRRRGGGWELGCAGGAGAAPGVRPDRRAGQDEAGETFAGHHMRRALARHQASSPKKSPGCIRRRWITWPSGCSSRASAVPLRIRYSASAGSPCSITAVPGGNHCTLTSSRASRMVADSAVNRAIACSAAGSVARCPEPAIQCASSSAMQVRRGGKTAWYSRCPRLWSRTSARNAAVVSLGDRDVVRVAVPAVRAEGDNRVRIELPHDVGDRGAQRGPMVLQGPVRVGQHLHAPHAELGGSRAQARPPGQRRAFAGSRRQDRGSAPARRGWPRRS